MLFAALPQRDPVSTSSDSFARVELLEHTISYSAATARDRRMIWSKLHASGPFQSGLPFKAILKEGSEKRKEKAIFDF
jgi:hypothetical protein